MLLILLLVEWAVGCVLVRVAILDLLGVVCILHSVCFEVSCVVLGVMCWSTLVGASGFLTHNRIGWDMLGLLLDRSCVLSYEPGVGCFSI